MTTFTIANNQNSLAGNLRIFLLAVLLSSCAVVEPQVRTVMVNETVVSEASPSVTIERAGEITPITPGTTLQIDDIVRTGPDATAVLLLENGNVEVVLLENTEIKISSLWVEIGEIFVKVKGRLREAFEVESEYGIAAVEGTVFSVRVDDGSGRSPVVYECVTLEGQVVVRSRTGSWQSVRLQSGRSAEVNANNQVVRQTLSRKQFNDLADRINRIERVYNPSAAELIAPNLVGLTTALARREAAARGVGVSAPVPTVTGNVAIGEIAIQDPAAGGRMRAGATIRIEVEVEPAVVPNLKGDTLEVARQKLTQADLRTGRVTEEPVLSGSFDRVMEQSESPGAEVIPQSEIDLVVAIRGRSVPRVTGYSEKQARDRIEDAELEVGRVSQRRGSDEPGRVVDQDPNSGDVVEDGSPVDLVVESGCRVPSVRNDTQAVAHQRIRNADLRPSNDGGSDINASARVNSTQPKEGSTIRCGSTVTIYYSIPVQ